MNERFLKRFILKTAVLAVIWALAVAGCAKSDKNSSGTDAFDGQQTAMEDIVDVSNPADSTVTDVFDAVPEAFDGQQTAMEDIVDVSNPADSTVTDVLVDAVPGDEAVQPNPFCKGKTALLYDPLNSDELELWPDDRLTRKDDQSPTGLRLDVNSENAKWTTKVPAFIKGSMSAFQYLSGFALNGQVLMRFTAAITEPPSTFEASLSDENLLFMDLATDKPEKVPYEAWLGNKDKDLFIQPILPLKPGHEYAVIMTTAYKASDGDCIAPSPALRSMLRLDAGDTAMKSTGKKMLEALKTLDISPQKVSAMTVFTTENDIRIIRETAKNAEKTDHDWIRKDDCTTKTNIKSCDVKYQAVDYRKNLFITTPEPKKYWQVPATIWMPANKKGPFPTILFGHGLGGNRWQAQGIARLMCPLGFAVIAAPALRHGGHPTADIGDTSNASIEFLGFHLENATFNPMELRGNFNQTTMDRIRLLATMLKYPDVDGDGVKDIATDHIVYWGISLGSLLGPSIISMEDSIRAAILTVGGGRLLLFATNGDKVKQLKPLIIKLAGSEERFNRLLVPVQSLVDAGDPDSYAPHVLKDRFSGAQDFPSVLFPTADQDDVVPPACAHALAQALGIPQMKPVFTPVPMLDVIDAPVMGNLYDGKTTAAYFQFNRVGGSSPKAAKHNNTPFSPEASLQATHFLKTWLADGIGEIIDPYPKIGTPPLPEGGK